MLLYVTTSENAEILQNAKRGKSETQPASMKSGLFRRCDSAEVVTLSKQRRHSSSHHRLLRLGVAQHFNAQVVSFVLQRGKGGRNTVVDKSTRQVFGKHLLSREE